MRNKTMRNNAEAGLRTFTSFTKLSLWAHVRWFCGNHQLSRVDPTDSRDTSQQHRCSNVCCCRHRHRPRPHYACFPLYPHTLSWDPLSICLLYCLLAWACDRTNCVRAVLTFLRKICSLCARNTPFSPDLRTVFYTVLWSLVWSLVPRV